MSSTDAHIKLCNSLMAADRMWEATIDTLPDAVYIFGPDKRLKKINRAGESLEQAARSFLAGRRCCDMLWGLEETGCMVDRAIASGQRNKNSRTPRDASEARVAAWRVRTPATTRKKAAATDRSSPVKK